MEATNAEQQRRGTESRGRDQEKSGLAVRGGGNLTMIVALALLRCPLAVQSPRRTSRRTNQWLAAPAWARSNAAEIVLREAHEAGQPVLHYLEIKSRILDSGFKQTSTRAHGELRTQQTSAPLPKGRPRQIRDRRTTRPHYRSNVMTGDWWGSWPRPWMIDPLRFVAFCALSFSTLGFYALYWVWSRAETGHHYRVRSLVEPSKFNVPLAESEPEPPVRVSAAWPKLLVFVLALPVLLFLLLVLGALVAAVRG